MLKLFFITTLLTHMIYLDEIFTDNLIDAIKHHQYIFIGESIHGVSEFTKFKYQFIKRFCDHNWICIFEADELGIKLSKHQRDNIKKTLFNFPLVMRTAETVELLTLLKERQIQYYGIDCIPRRLYRDYPKALKVDKLYQDKTYNINKLSDTYFDWREKLMTTNLINIFTKNKNRKFIIFLHNMHIKNKGSYEQNSLNLKSVKERLGIDLQNRCICIAQLALSGECLNNDLSQFTFHIHDKYSVESLVSGENNIISLHSTMLPSNLVAWHHAFERESIPVKEQYDWVVIYSSINQPTIC